MKVRTKPFIVIDIEFIYFRETPDVIKNSYFRRILVL